jgi:Ser-tRNA(Ala) deacylase AlaX
VSKVSKPTDANEVAALPTDAQATCVEVELSAPVDPDSLVECVVDWDRRYDFMQQHTAQHLFSAVADKLFQTDTVGWALGSDSVSVDLSSNPLLTAEQLQRIEDETNSYIAQAVPVSWSVHGREDLGDVVKNDDCFRGMVKGTASDLASLRLVRIEGLDLNPCGGTHLQNLAEINVFKIIGTEKDRKSLRVRFVAGQRALQYFRNCIQREAVLSQKFSAPSTEHAKLLDKLLLDRKDFEKKLEAAQEEIAGYYGQDLLNQIQTAGMTGGTLVLKRHRAQGKLKFLLKVVSVVFDKLPILRSNGISLPDVVVLYVTGGELEDEESPEFIAAQAASNIKSGKKGAAIARVEGVTYPFVLATSEGTWLTEDRKAEVLSLLDAKGGGRPGLLQGQSAKVLSARNDVMTALGN